MLTVDVLRIVVGLLCTVQVSLLSLGQQRAAISCTFEFAQQAKMYLCITKGLRGDIQLAIIVCINTSLQTLLRRRYIFLLILCSHENPLSMYISIMHSL